MASVNSSGGGATSLGAQGGVQPLLENEIGARGEALKTRRPVDEPAIKTGLAAYQDQAATTA